MPKSAQDHPSLDGPQPSIRSMNCGAPLTPVHRSCPECGSGHRQISVSDSVTLDLKERMDLEQWKPGQKKPYREVRSGDSFFKKTREWHRIHRIIDRENDWYFEHIEDEHGTVVRHCEEPLTQHRGHGSAKKKLPQDADRGDQLSTGIDPTAPDTEEGP